MLNTSNRNKKDKILHWLDVVIPKNQGYMSHLLQKSDKKMVFVGFNWVTFSMFSYKSCMVGGIVYMQPQWNRNPDHKA